MYGRVDGNTSTSAAFSLDGGAAQVFNSPVASEVQHNVQLYSSGSLASNEHSLVMTANSEDPVIVDYFIVRANPPGDPQTSGGNSGTSKKSSSSIAPIAGGAAGGALLLIALAAGFYWFYWRKRKGVSKPTSKPALSPCEPRILSLLETVLI